MAFNSPARARLQDLPPTAAAPLKPRRTLNDCMAIDVFTFEDTAGVARTFVNMLGAVEGPARRVRPGHAGMAYASGDNDMRLDERRRRVQREMRPGA